MHIIVDLLFGKNLYSQQWWSTNVFQALQMGVFAVFGGMNLATASCVVV